MIGVRSVFRAYAQTLSVLPRIRIWVPLLLYLGIKLVLMFVYLSTVPGPASSFWGLFVFGESAGSIAHYPSDLLLMPTVLNRLSLVLDVFVNVLFQGAAIAMFAETFMGRVPAIRPAFRRTWRRYWPLVGVSLIFSMALYGSVLVPGVLARISAIQAPPGALTAGAVAFGLLTQALLIFATPYVLLSTRSVLGALKGSLIVCFRSFSSVLLLVALPFLLSLPVLYVQSKLPLLIERLSPDILIHVQVSAELVQWMSTFLLLGGLTALFVRRVQENAP